MRLDPRDAVRFSALRSSAESWPELQIRITQLARERSPPPGLRLRQAKLSRKSNQVARGRIRRFEFYMPSQAVGSLWAVRARPSAYWLAKNVDDLHSDSVNITKQTALTEKGEGVSGRGDAVNMHDILTGSDPSGRFSTAGGDTTCGNWTKSGDGSAIVGHHDRVGLKDTWHMRSWNSSHGSRGCSQEQLKASGGAGLLYCFALTETT